MKTTQVKLQDDPQTVARVARALHERFTVTAESADHSMHGKLSHLVRRWLTIIVIIEAGEICPPPNGD